MNVKIGKAYKILAELEKTSSQKRLDMVSINEEIKEADIELIEDIELFNRQVDTISTLIEKSEYRDGLDQLIFLTVYASNISSTLSDLMNVIVDFSRNTELFPKEKIPGEDDMELYRKVILRNKETMEDTFLGELHEGSRWNHECFFQLFDAINTAASKEVSETQDLLVHINEIKSWTLRKVIFHLSRNDLYVIKNYNEKLINDYIDRLNLVVKSFINNEPIDESYFNDELRCKVQT